MRLAINLAQARSGLTGENPSVGCLIVKNDEIISSYSLKINASRKYHSKKPITKRN